MASRAAQDQNRGTTMAIRSPTQKAEEAMTSEWITEIRRLKKIISKLQREIYELKLELAAAKKGKKNAQH